MARVAPERRTSRGCHIHPIREATIVKVVHMPSPNLHDLTGKQFGRLSVLCRSENKGHDTMWLCRCECGTEKPIRANSLAHHGTQSCGCYQKEGVSKRATRHGYARPGKKGRTYNIWVAMRQRCNDPHGKSYENYGGRGITVCPEWDSFEQFLADMNECPGKGYSIGRIDGSIGYCKSNCRWETPIQQGRNTRRNHMITYNGETHCLSEWAEILGLSYYVLRSRLNNGWTVDRMFNQKPRKYTGTPSKSKQTFTFHGKTQSTAQWAKEFGLQFMTLHSRLKNGWSIERALTEPVHKSR